MKKTINKSVTYFKILLSATLISLSQYSIVLAEEFKYTYLIEDIYVKDGDTVVGRIKMGLGTCRKETIRLVNYDAPETYRPSNQEEYTLGLAAKNELIKLVKDVAYIRVTSGDNYRGSFGRVLGDLILKDGRSVSNVMKLKGYVKKDDW